VRQRALPETAPISALDGNIVTCMQRRVVLPDEGWFSAAHGQTPS
jgi:hypothetical protein